MKFTRYAQEVRCHASVARIQCAVALPPQHSVATFWHLGCTSKEDGELVCCWDRTTQWDKLQNVDEDVVVVAVVGLPQHGINIWSWMMLSVLIIVLT